MRLTSLALSPRHHCTQCGNSAVLAVQLKKDWMQHHNDVMMGAIAFQITSLTIVYSTVYSDADQKKHQSSASLAFVWGIHQGPHKWPVTPKMFPFDDVIMKRHYNKIKHMRETDNGNEICSSSFDALCFLWWFIVDSIAVSSHVSTSDPIPSHNGDVAANEPGFASGWVTLRPAVNNNYAVTMSCRQSVLWKVPVQGKMLVGLMFPRNPVSRKVNLSVIAICLDETWSGIIILQMQTTFKGRLLCF